MGFLLPQTWAKDAACAGTMPDLFHETNAELVRSAKRICEGCPVKLDCLNDALVREDYNGVWGGLDGKQRARLRRQPLRATA